MNIVLYCKHFVEVGEVVAATVFTFGVPGVAGGIFYGEMDFLETETMVEFINALHKSEAVGAVGYFVKEI